MNTLAKFEKALHRQEELIIANTFRFDDETQAEYDTKLQKRIATACATFKANEISGINSICGINEDVNYCGFRIMRRKADEIDNVYVKRDNHNG